MGEYVPTKITWNNSSDCHELVATPPFNKDELVIAGFPAETAYIIHDINDFILTHCKSLPCYPNLSGFIKDAIASQFYALIKETPEDSSFKDERFFLSFGRDDKWRRYPVSIRLGLNNPNWAVIEKETGFIPAKYFKDFVESFPGLVFSHIEYPEFILPAEYFTNVTEFLSQDITGACCISVAEHETLKQYLFFQHDYWGISRFISKDGLVFELKESPFSLTSTGIYFKEWIYSNVEKLDDPKTRQQDSRKLK